MYYNLLAQIAHGGKVFTQNEEQLYKLEITAIDDDSYAQEIIVANPTTAPVNTKEVSA
jgi:hypothetical protein